MTRQAPIILRISGFGSYREPSESRITVSRSPLLQFRESGASRTFFTQFSPRQTCNTSCDPIHSKDRSRKNDNSKTSIHSCRWDDGIHRATGAPSTKARKHQKDRRCAILSLPIAPDSSRCRSRSLPIAPDPLTLKRDLSGAIGNENDFFPAHMPASANMGQSGALRNVVLGARRRERRIGFAALLRA
jgi:hypothetical protein